MLVIRDAQWEAFEREAALQVLLRPRPDLRGEALRAACARARAAFARAARHGLSGAGALSRFATLAEDLGPDFDERLPWARTILAWDRPAEERLSQLEAAAAARASEG